MEIEEQDDHNQKDRCSICNNSNLINKNIPYYTNQKCYHNYCEQCVLKTGICNNTDTCYVKQCKSLYNGAIVAKFFEDIQIQKQISISFVDIQCYNLKCKFQEKLQVPTNSKYPEYYKCSKCQQISCLLHNCPMGECLCSCFKCLRDLKYLGNKMKVCLCGLYVCETCKQYKLEQWICNCSCELCLNPQNQNCRCLFNTCTSCFSQLDEIALYKQLNCPHFYCKFCQIQSNKQKIQQIKCLLCN